MISRAIGAGLLLSILSACNCSSSSAERCQLPLAPSGEARCRQLQICQCERRVECGEQFDTSSCSAEAEWICANLGNIDALADKCVPYFAGKPSCARRAADIGCGDRPSPVAPAQRAVGEPCHGADCGPDGWCPAGGEFDCRACQPGLDAGVRCSPQLADRPYLGRCAPGLVCEATDAGTTCVPRLGGGADCADSGECASGRCLRAGSAGSRCAPLPKGSPCDPRDWAPCDDGRLFCDGVSCVDRIPLGGTCQRGGADEGCADPQAACIDGRCQILPLFSRPRGAQCAYHLDCQEGLFCDATCQPRKGSGARCVGEDCEAQLRCTDFQFDCGLTGGCLGTCLPWPSLGEPCADACKLPLACVAGTCQELSAPPLAPPARLGDACDHVMGKLCVRGLFCSPERVCVESRAPGAACSQDFECRSLKCGDGGTCVAPCP